MRDGKRRALTLAGALLAISGLGAGLGTVTASSAGTTDPVTTFTKTSDIRITMNDGIRLDSDEYVPNSGCPCPVILVQTPYRKDGAVGEYNPYFPSHGYAEIVVDVRGTGSSEGYWTSFGPPEQRDSVELVNWAVHRPFSNGVIGLAGVSYSAINQLLTVEQPGTEAVKAIFPIVPMGDAYRDVVFSGGNTDTGFIPLWLGLVNGLNMQPADDWQSNPQIALNAESQHLMDIARFTAPAVADSTLGAYESMLPDQAQTYRDQAYDGRFYRTVDPLSHIDRVTVPTFIVGGEYDLFQRSEPLLYRGIGLPTSQKKLLFGPWYHGNPTANLTADDGTSPVHDSLGTLIPSTNNLSLAWFDHWLKGIDNGIDAFPTVETWQIGADQWKPALAFPSLATRYQGWYLSGSPSGSMPKAIYNGFLSPDGVKAGTADLLWQPATGTCSKSTAQWTAGLVALGSCADDDTYAQMPGLTFTTRPFAQPFAISGPLMADLWISSNRSDTTLVTTVDDVAPDGTVARITAGSLVASLRSFTSTPCGAKVMDCSVYMNNIPVVPWHPYTRASQLALNGNPTEVKVEIFPTSMVLQPGHRLRLAITTGDLPHQAPNASILADSVGGQTTLYFDSKHPSRLFLGTSSGTPSFQEPAPAAGNSGIIIWIRPVPPVRPSAPDPGVREPEGVRGGATTSLNLRPAAASVGLEPEAAGRALGLLVVAAVLAGLVARRRRTLPRL